MSLPLIQQGNILSAQRSNAAAQHFVANSWIGMLICYIVVMVIYYTNTWNVSGSFQRKSLHSFIVLQSLAFPMLSTSIFSSNGSIYKQSAVFDSQFRLNQTALDVIGLPALTGSNAWANLSSNLAVSLLVRETVWI